MKNVIIFVACILLTMVLLISCGDNKEINSNASETVEACESDLFTE